MERIETADDPRITDYQRIREAHLVSNRGVFIAEGIEVVRTLVTRSKMPIRSIFIGEKHVERMRDVLLAVEGRAPVYVATQAIMNEMVGFEIHRGCLAAGSRIEPPAWEQLLLEAAARTQVRTVLVLEAIANHDNVGGLFRNAAAFGVDAVLLDPRSADPLYRKAIRVSMGATLTVPFARSSPWPDALDRLRASGYAVWSLTPREGARDITEILSPSISSATTLGTLPSALSSMPPNALPVPLPAKVAFLLGAEGQGLSREALERSDACWRIGIEAPMDSLNVATASGIALFVLRAARACSMDHAMLPPSGAEPSLAINHPAES